MTDLFHEQRMEERVRLQAKMRKEKQDQEFARTRWIKANRGRWIAAGYPEDITELIHETADTRSAAS